jgi:hypothetical protein
MKRQVGHSHKNQTARGHPTLNSHEPQDRGSHVANENRNALTS